MKYSAGLRIPVLMLLLAFVPGSFAEPLVLVEDGKAQASIVIGSEASDQAKEAAQILQENIEKMTGVVLPIAHENENITGTRILVGRSKAVADLGVEVPSGFTYQMNEEGFVFKTVGKNLVLAGNEDRHYRGTIYAVYDFLEELGCRWFFPGPYGEVIPHLDRMVVSSTDRLERPDFRIRNLWYSGWFPADEQDQQWLQTWYDRNKMSSLSFLSLPGDGSIIRLAPPEKYFESHPEIYALDEDGNRVKDMLCLTNPETIKIAIETIRETFRENPDQVSFGFAPPDGFPMCHCKNCQAEILGFEGKGYGDPSLSDVWFRFTNQIAKEIYKEFPDRRLFTNGYANRVRPPEGIESFSPNLGIQSAIISACSIHRIGDPKCWQRILYKQILDRWTRDLNCVFIYDYDPGTSLINLPFPSLHNLRYDIPYFKERGVWGFWTEGNNNWMVTHLNYYVRSKLMWDSKSDVDALVRDYCEKFYGDAGNAVEKYIRTLEKAIEDTTLHETWGRLMQWKVVLPPVQPKLDRLMEQAEKRANTPEIKQRVRVLRLVHDHTNAYVAMEQAVARGEFQEGASWADTMAALRDQVGEVQSGLLPHSPDWVRTFRTSLEWHKNIDQDIANRINGVSGELVVMLPQKWEFKTDPKDIGVLYQWYLPNTGGRWDSIDTTLYWEAQGYQDEQGWGYWGKAWYRTGFTVPKEVEGKPLRLTLGAVYNEGVWIWVNGMFRRYEKTHLTKSGYPDERSPIDVDVTDLIRPGEVNTVAVLVNTPMPGRNARGGLHRRVFLWMPK